MKKLNKINVKKAVSAGFGGMAFSLGSLPCFAAGRDILSNIENLLKEYYGKITGITVGIGIFCAAIAIGVMMFAPTDEGSGKGKKWLVRILVGIALLLSIGAVYNLIQNMTAGSGFDMDEFLR